MVGESMSPAEFGARLDAEYERAMARQFAAAPGGARSHAGDIVASMEALAAAGDDRFARSELLAFMRDVHAGNTEVTDTGGVRAGHASAAEAYPHALGVDTPTAEEIARRVAAMEDLWRTALAGDGLPDPSLADAQAAPARAGIDVHALWNAASQASTDAAAAASFDAFWQQAREEIASRVDGTPESRAAEEERLRAVLQRAFAPPDAGGVDMASYVAGWENPDEAELFAREGERAAERLAAMTRSTGLASPEYMPAPPAAATLMRPYVLADAEFNPVISREMAAAAGLPDDAAPEESMTRAQRLFEEGVAAFNEGRLQHAVHVFEAVLHGVPDHSDAWRMLGATHAELDDDRAAIACLERAVDADPYNLPALLALGVSYVNERDKDRALATLQAWVAHHPQLHGVEAKPDAYSDGSLMDTVMQLMLAAQERLPLDPDVATVIGVLYNATQHYDDAVGALRKAIAERERAGSPDYSLWNKLGATLSTAGKHAEALRCYARALSMKPAYARGWLNVGIAFFNVKDYAKAAGAYLQAARLAPSSGHIWALLRVVFSKMLRPDLVARTEACNVDVFAGEFPTPVLSV